MNEHRPSITGPSAAAQTYSLLTLGAAQLLIGAHELRTIESAADVDRTTPPEHGIGWITSLDRALPVYALTAKLDFVEGPAPGFRLCAIVSGDDAMFGLLCHHAQVVREGEIKVSSLPATMWRPGSPLLGMGATGSGMCLATSIRLLASHLGLDLEGTSASTMLEDAS